MTVDALRRGELAIDQVVAVVRRAPWWADREVCELARNATVHQLRTALGKYPFPDYPNPTTPQTPTTAVTTTANRRRQTPTPMMPSRLSILSLNRHRRSRGCRTGCGSESAPTAGSG